MKPSCFKVWLISTRERLRSNPSYSTHSTTAEYLSYELYCNRPAGILLGDIAVAINELRRLEFDISKIGNLGSSQARSILIEPVPEPFQPVESSKARALVPPNKSLRLCGGRLCQFGLEIDWDSAWRKTYRDVKYDTSSGIEAPESLETYRSRFDD